MEENFQIIGYSEIDLSKTKLLLDQQGILLIDLRWFQARTLIWLLSQNYLNKPNTIINRWLYDFVTFLMFIPLILNSRLIELH
ncbi:MAG: hypothetical protein U1E13_07885, partial [Methylophilaceae bacterium]|nr:hypothetical protein [Methylophilaceae bacterium]